MNLLTLPTTIPWLSLLWLLPAAAAVLVALLPAAQLHAMRVVGTVVSALTLTLATLLFLAYNPAGARYQFVESATWVPQLGISYTLGADGIGLAMLLLNGIVTLAATLLSWNIEARGRGYWSLLLLLSAGAYGVFSALDLFLLVLFYEMTILPKFLLIGTWGRTRREYGATKLALYMMAGSALIIAGMIAVYLGSGLRTFDLRLLSEVALFSQAFQATWFPVVFLGFAVLAGMAPLHAWAPTGHVAAPTAASMMLAGVMMKLGGYACLRVAFGVLPQGALEWLPALAVVTMLGALFGSTLALVQRDFKYMVAYSSISHMALALMGMAAGNVVGLTGAVLQLFAHGVLTALLFGIVGRVVYDRAHTRNMDELGGVARTMPFAAVLFIIGALSSMGMPGLAGFWAEFNVLTGTFATFPLLAILAAISIPITGAYTLRAVVKVFYGEQMPATLTMPPLTWQESSALVLLAVVLVGVGLFPNALSEPIRTSVQPMVEALTRGGFVAGR